MWVVNATPRPLYPREIPCTHCIGGWVAPRAGLDGCGKSHLASGFDPRTVHPLASRYPDCASQDHDKVHTMDEFLQHINQEVVVDGGTVFY